MNKVLSNGCVERLRSTYDLGCVTADLEAICRMGPQVASAAGGRTGSTADRNSRVPTEQLASSGVKLK